VGFSQPTLQALATLAETIDRRAACTAGHARRVAAYSRLLAVELGLPSEVVGGIEWSAALHDIGKAGIPDAILFKSGPLDDAEWLLLRGSPVIGAGMVAGLPATWDLFSSILHHHERADARGYPDGLAGESIPVGARVIAVAVAFDAMTTERPYRRCVDAERALDELIRGAGSQFDRNCVAAAVQLIGRGKMVPPAHAGAVRARLRVV
jgi:HD-GYP domain-containing protein (c-di-GMP phosphodiesterase class II)